MKENILNDIQKTLKIEKSSNTYINNIISSFESGSYRLETLNLVDKVKAPGIYCLDLTAVDESPIRQNIVGDLMQEVFRLINKGDIDQVAGTVEGISEYDLMQLPQFTAGQALFTGVGMQMPVRVRVLE